MPADQADVGGRGLGQPSADQPIDLAEAVEQPGEIRLRGQALLRQTLKRRRHDARIATAIVDPDAGIAHGYAGTTIRTKDGLTIQGLLIKEGNPLIMRTMGGATQMIPLDRVKARERLPRSIMISAAELGMNAQDVADVIAFLRTR